MVKPALLVEVFAIGEGYDMTKDGIDQPCPLHPFAPVVKVVFLSAIGQDMCFLDESRARNKTKRGLARVTLDSGRNVSGGLLHLR